MGCRVLIVEDEFVLADNLEIMFTQGGHSVCGKASTAADALLLAKIQLPDIVLMDVRLAGTVDGVDAARMILGIHNCGVVYITGNADKATRARMQSAAPAAVVLSKPVLWSEIEAACARVSSCVNNP
jgi:CheY-like chemotaxis protein